MKKRQNQLHVTLVIGAFVLSTALGVVMATAQQQQMRLSQGEQMGRNFDPRIEDNIELRLARSASLSGTDITVTVENQVATLAGVVGSEQDQERALRLARQTRGVREVKNNLRIDQQAVEQRRSIEVDDKVLAQRVATKLTTQVFPLAESDEEWLWGGWEIEGYNWEFDLDVDDGIVTLDGDVTSYDDITKAVQAARSVPGVKAVNSELRVDNYNYWGHSPY